MARTIKPLHYSQIVWHWPTVLEIVIIASDKDVCPKFWDHVANQRSDVVQLPGRRL